MPPETLRFILLGGSAVVIAAVGYTLIWMVRRTRNVSQQRARKGASARRRVDAAIDRHELGRSTITVPDRFEALGDGADRPCVVLTAEPHAGDLSSAMVVPQPPFDVTDQVTWARWEAADRKRRRATMLAGYLAHPLPRVRVEALELLGSAQVEDPELGHRIALLLLDEDTTLRTRAARAAWTAGRLPTVVGALHDRTGPDGAEGAEGAGGADHLRMPRAYRDLENAAPRGEELSLPRALAARHSDDRDEVALIAELVELYAPDRIADRPAVGDLGRRLDVEGGDAGRRRATAALGAARGREAADDLAGRWA